LTASADRSIANELRLPLTRLAEAFVGELHAEHERPSTDRNPIC
jgi:hypothetical protein